MWPLPAPGGPSQAPGTAERPRGAGSALSASQLRHGAAGALQLAAQADQAGHQGRHAGAEPQQLVQRAGRGQLDRGQGQPPGASVTRGERPRCWMGCRRAPGRGLAGEAPPSCSCSARLLVPPRRLVPRRSPGASPPGVPRASPATPPGPMGLEPPSGSLAVRGARHGPAQSGTRPPHPPRLPCPRGCGRITCSCQAQAPPQAPPPPVPPALSASGPAPSPCAACSARASMRPARLAARREERWPQRPSAAAAASLPAVHWRGCRGPQRTACAASPPLQ